MDSSGPKMPRTSRSTTGCQSCRRRKKKCDGKHPACTACIKNNLQCEWPVNMVPRKPISRRRCHRLNHEFAIPAQIQPMTTVFAVPNRQMILRLLSHFEKSSPLWLTICKDRRRTAFLGQVIPAAIRNPIVLHCVLALSAADLSKYEALDSDLMTISHDYYGQALRGIQSELTNNLDSMNATNHVYYSDDVLLAVLMLCVHEAQNFTQSERILPHINAAATLCCNRLNDSTIQNNDMRGLLFEIFCYIFPLVAYSHGKSLELSLAYQVFDSPFLTGHSYEGMLLGTSRKLFSFILRISMITSSQHSMPLDPISRFELETIEFQLSNLKFQKPTDEDDEDASDHAIISEMYRLACLLHTKVTLNPQLSIKSAIIQNIVTDFVSQLEELAISSPANNILAWPLVIAGLCAVTQNHQRLISARLRKNHETWRSDILSQNALFLVRKWKKERGPPENGTTRNEVLYSARTVLNLQVPAILL